MSNAAPDLVELSWPSARLWLRSIFVTALKVAIPIWLLFSVFILLGLPGPLLWFGSASPMLDALKVGGIFFVMIVGIGLPGYLALILITLLQRLFRKVRS